MRLAKDAFAVAGGLFLAGAIGLIGVWALAAGSVLVLCAAVVAAVAMERPDYSDIEGLVPSASDDVLG